MAKGLKDIPPVAQMAIMALLAVVLVAVPAYFYVFPLFEQRTTLDKQVRDLKKENDNNRAIEQQQTEYINQIAQLETQLRTLRLLVPDEPSTDQFMKTIFQTALDAGVHVRTFVTQPLVTKDYYVEMPFKIHIDGTYWSVVNYFERLAQEQRIIGVTDIQLGSPVGGGMGSYEVPANASVGSNCLVTTYFNRQTPPTANPAPKK
jgi:type IV pilus assembly protein PilO